MKRLFIICTDFPPEIGPRMGYLCKYLKRYGWQINVLTEYFGFRLGFEFLTGNAEVTRIEYYHAKGRITRKLEWIMVMILDILFHYKDRRMIKYGRKILKANEYKCILCSTWRTFPLPAAAQLAKEFKLPYIADIRDVPEQFPKDEYLRHNVAKIPFVGKIARDLFMTRLIKERQKSIKNANVVTTIAEWHQNLLRAENPNIELIYNGFDPELFYPQEIKVDKFIVCFTGRVWSLKLRDPELLFVATKQLANDGLINPQTYRIVFYTQLYETQDLLLPMAQRIGIEQFIDFYDYIPADQVPRILNESSVLLSLTNKFDPLTGPKGMMTTKFFEQLAVCKPILCVRSDESCMAETIKMTNSGLAATTVEEVVEFLKKYYAQWQTQGFTRAETDTSKLSLFSRKEQADKFNEIIERISN